MKRSYEIVGLLIFFLAVCLLSSFVMLDTFSNPDPVLPKAAQWINDNKVLSAFFVSEVTGLFSKRVRGIAQGVIAAAKWIFQHLVLNRPTGQKK